MEQTNAQSRSIIAIGASAGGVKAIRSFFSCLPANCPHSFIVVQHLSPHYKSLMPKLLEQVTSLKVCHITDQLAPERGCVYLPSSHECVVIRSGRLCLIQKTDRSGESRPIDLLFSSLAKEEREHAIGIILTGASNDGTEGARAIKDAGGLIFTQSPAQAEFKDMPQSAINAGLVDAILPVEELAERLEGLLNAPRHISPDDLEADEEHLQSLLAQIKNTTGCDLRPYKRTTLLRRIVRRMNECRCASIENYMRYLNEHTDEAAKLVDEALIGVTKFFRDDFVWDLLGTQSRAIACQTLTNQVLKSHGVTS